MSLNSVNHDKIQNSIVTTSTTYLDIATFPVILIESAFSLLPLCMYLSIASNHIEQNMNSDIFNNIYNYYQMWGIPNSHSNFVLFITSLYRQIWHPD